MHKTNYFSGVAFYEIGCWMVVYVLSCSNKIICEPFVINSVQHIVEET